jgi:hypothetical protein
MGDNISAAPRASNTLANHNMYLMLQQQPHIMHIPMLSRPACWSSSPASRPQVAVRKLAASVVPPVLPYSCSLQKTCSAAAMPAACCMLGTLLLLLLLLLLKTSTVAHRHTRSRQQSAELW